MPDQELRAAVARSTSVKESARVLIKGLAQRLQDALEAATSFAALKASISETVTDLNTSSDLLADDVAAHTVAENEE